MLRDVAGVIVAWNTQHRLDAKKHSNVAFVDELLKAVGAKVAAIAPRVRDVSTRFSSLSLSLPALSFGSDWVCGRC